MRILGIDPGTATTGYGIIEAEGSLVKAGEYGSISTSPAYPLPLRLANLYEQVLSLIRREKPSCLAVEEIFFSRNTRTAMAVGQARGVVILAATHAGLEVAEYTPLEVKQAVTGYGRAPKYQVQRMVQAILNLPQLPQPDDAADALAVALCHVAHQTLRNLGLNAL
ncbi:MAG: crossover junction endodeoxyribonuclease RuvC [Thermanaeromonas sp.]|uniref:crossover junction endodeoxyribonuclease RuvC n=1 Tax=Thermanaeromonas sp. TaxID=2003697 RepID=UPI00243C79D2|nr:crossover junction endodeoxyribonuclease RuvC [Thermanaeromonas sp.]MCG0277505.1 crossover junction endodeoxyribonuclease RuvC [Thermanaeromonas sp.]